MKPILFSTPMVQAILNGTKTQTRRVIKNIRMLNETTPMFSFRNANATGICPYGKPGDILWVREKFAPPAFTQKADAYMYAADFHGSKVREYAKSIWKPSIHMPFTACRLFLKIKNIRVERLQSISREDAIAEGINRGWCQQEGKPDIQTFENYETGKQDIIPAIVSFATLWQKINGLESYAANPWVWVIEFEKAEKPTV
jgi:hypothetical protein